MGQGKLPERVSRREFPVFSERVKTKTAMSPDLGIQDMQNSAKKKKPADADEQNARMMLLHAGITLFADKGYAGASVREIVSMAGVTKPVLYYYFKSKEGLLRAILDWAAGEQEKILAEALQTRGTAFEKLLHLYHRIYQGLMENQQLFRLINNLFFGPLRGVPSYDIERFHRRMVEVIKDICASGMRHGEVRETNPEEAALLVLGVTDFCFHLDYLHPESMDPKRADRLLRLAFQGLESS
jgi:TetR/AcrR family transcriptional regulator